MDWKFRYAVTDQSVGSIIPIASSPRHPARMDAKRGDHFIQTALSLPIGPIWITSGLPNNSPEGPRDAGSGGATSHRKQVEVGRETDSNYGLKPRELVVLPAIEAWGVGTSEGFQMSAFQGVCRAKCP